MRDRHLAVSSIVCVLFVISVGAAGRDLRLLEAARNQDHEAVLALLKQGIDVNATQPDGASALHWAAYWNDDRTADLLIRAGADVNAKNELGATSLWLASSHGNAAMIGRLLKAGADPNAALPGGETPLMSAARTGVAEAVTPLLDRGADVNVAERSRGQTALMWAVAQQHASVVRLLLKHGANVHARSSVRRRWVNTGRASEAGDTDGTPVEEARGGFTPLLFAARNGDIESAKLLIAAGANVDDAAPSGASPLVIAAHSGQSALAAVLLEHGADPNAAGAGYTALHAAILRGDLELLNKLLSHGADPNRRLLKATSMRRLSDDWAFSDTLISSTPLSLAARFSDPTMMRALAARGADPLVAMSDGTTVLMAAIQGGRGRVVTTANSPAERERNTIEAIRLAIALGVDVATPDDVGNTAMHHAAISLRTASVQVLADNGALVNARNKEGLTPLAFLKVPRPRETEAPPDNGRTQRMVDLLHKLGAHD
jgi:ankyrin repeat protein